MDILNKLKSCNSAEEILNIIETIDNDINHDIEDNYEGEYSIFLKEKGEYYLSIYTTLEEHPLIEEVFTLMVSRKMNFYIFEIIKDYDDYLFAERVQKAKESVSALSLQKINEVAEYFRGNDLELFCVYDENMRLYTELSPADDIRKVFEDFFCITVKHNGTILVVSKDTVNELYGFVGLNDDLIVVGEEGVAKMIRGSEAHYMPYIIKRYELSYKLN